MFWTRVIFVILTASMSGNLAHAYRKNYYANDLNHNSFETRVDQAKLHCMSKYSDLADATFTDREALEDGKDYEFSVLQNISVPIQDTFKGIKNFFWGDTEEDRDMDAIYQADLEILSTLARYYSEEASLDPFDQICLSTCVVNQLISYSKDIKYSDSISAALNAGKGSCGHFSKIAVTLLNNQDIRASEKFSLKHSFVLVNIDEYQWIIDPQQDGRVTCRFISFD
jgi:hypothetical protein